ncbi:MAG: hypothetical protein IKK58_05160, partial [Clostridia bacterium]|nr:hypothetical protein [Clostridia bacterium]
NQQHLSKKLSLKISRKGNFKGNSMSKPKKNLEKARQIKGLGNSGLKKNFIKKIGTKRTDIKRYIFINDRY